MNLKKIFTPQRPSDNGFISLMSVLILAGVVMATITGVTMYSLEGSKMSLNQKLSHTSLVLADACAEHVISRLGRNLKYDGESSIIVKEGKSCEVVSIEDIDNQTKLIKTKSDFKNYTSRIRVEVTKSGPNLQIEKWEEVEDFN